jgi:excisionase family DNA binding protein
MAGTLSLKECAERLGVHYMTAYRYIRHGRLSATKVAGEWRVLPSDLEALLANEAAPAERGSVDWTGRLEDRLMSGDESGAWSLIESALSSGMTPDKIHVDLLAPALRRIGEGWRAGQVTIAEEHQATAVATKLIGRLGPRFARRGRRRGRVLIGTPPGERHTLSVAIVADLLRGAGWEVIELGSDLPVEEFVRAASKAAPLAAVAVSLSNREFLETTAELVVSLKDAVAAPVIVGGTAIDAETASMLNADGWASDGRTAIEAIAAVAAAGQASSS